MSKSRRTSDLVNAIFVNPDNSANIHEGTQSPYFLLDTGAVVTPQQGMMFWDADRQTVGVQMNGVEARLGQDNFWYVKNQTGSDILKGTAVMAVGALGASSRILVAPMVADGSVEEQFLLGIAAEDILTGEDGFVMNIGKIRGIDTTQYGTEAGQILYCDPAVPGGLTITEPEAPNLDIPIAFTVDYKSNGTLAVRTLPGYHIGELHDVYVNNPSNEDTLVYNSLSQRWENAPATGGVGSVDANEGLEVINESLGTIYNSTIDDTVQSIAVGGIAAGTPASQLKSLNLVQVLDNMLFPTILPSILTNKSVSLTVNGASGTLEIGQTISRTLTATFNRGLIKNGNNSTGPELVGLATQYTFTGTGISSTAQVGSTLEVSNTIVSGSNNWAVTVNHDAGTGAYYDNKANIANNLDGSRVAGTVTDSSSSPSVTGIYPYFYYKSSSPISVSGMVSAIQTGAATKVLSSSSGTLSIPYNLSSQYIAVAYPSSSPLKNTYYVTALDTGSITLVFDPVSTPVSVDSPNGYWTGVNYAIHVSSNSITNSNPTIELRN